MGFTWTTHSFLPYYYKYIYRYIYTIIYTNTYNINIYKFINKILYLLEMAVDRIIEYPEGFLLVRCFIIVCHFFSTYFDSFILFLTPTVALTLVRFFPNLYLYWWIKYILNGFFSASTPHFSQYTKVWSTLIFHKLTFKWSFFSFFAATKKAIIYKYLYVCVCRCVCVCVG